MEALRVLVDSRAGRLAAITVGVIAVATLVALVAMWPSGDERRVAGSVVVDTDKAKVVSISSEGCEQFAGPGCRLIRMELLSGPNKGEESSFSMPGTDQLSPDLSPGDRVRVSGNVPPGIDPDLADELPIDDPNVQPYAFVDFERQAPLMWLAIVFAVIVVILGRLRGALALVGLVVSLVLLVKFVVPGILDGDGPVLLALVGSMAVMLVTIGLTHGLSAKSFAAILGTTAALLITAGLAKLGVDLAHITGFSSEEATLLLGSQSGDLSLQGLVLAGMVIGALGVLDDLTVSQASTVMALRRANPDQGWRLLYRGALDVGRDHVSATVNTLVLAYAGASLPVLLIFANQGTSLGEAVNREPVATQVIGMLVGSIGLIAAVPITTALAALLASRLPQDALGGGAHEGHAH